MLFDNIERLAAADGVVAVAVDAPGRPRIFRGAESWAPVLDGAIALRALAAAPAVGEDEVRALTDDHTVVALLEGGEVVAVAVPTGHPIAKSLRRTLRRYARIDAGQAAAEARRRPRAKKEAEP